jgi:hypothetical protein
VWEADTTISESLTRENWNERSKHARIHRRNLTVQDLVQLPHERRSRLSSRAKSRRAAAADIGRAGLRSVHSSAVAGRDSHGRVRASLLRCGGEVFDRNMPMWRRRCIQRRLGPGNCVLRNAEGPGRQGPAAESVRVRYQLEFVAGLARAVLRDLRAAGGQLASTSMANTLRSKKAQFSRLADGEPASAAASSGAGRGTIAARQRARGASTRSDRSDRSRRPPYVGKESCSPGGTSSTQGCCWQCSGPAPLGAASHAPGLRPVSALEAQPQHTVAAGNAEGLQGARRNVVVAVRLADIGGPLALVAGRSRNDRLAM